MVLNQTLVVGSDIDIHVLETSFLRSFYNKILIGVNIVTLGNI